MNNDILKRELYFEELKKVSEEIHLKMTQSELMQLFIDTFTTLLPDRRICFRLTGANARELDFLYASGTLITNTPHLMTITDAAKEGQVLSEANWNELFSVGNIRMVESYSCILKGTTSGFCYLLCDENTLYGAVNIEYAQQVDTNMLLADKHAVLPFIHLLVAGLRSTKLISETTMLKEYWQKLIENANAPVVAVDPDARIFLVNKAFERLTNRQRVAVIGKDFFELVSRHSTPRLMTTLSTAMKGHSVTNIEIRFPKTEFDDEFAHIAFNSAPISNSYGKLESVIFVGQDLTTVKSLQRQIIHSEKLVTLGQIAAGVSHELNNPLTSITVYSDYLKRKLEGQIANTDLSKIQSIMEAAGRIQNFTRELVSYARPSEDKPALMDIHAVLKRSVSFCEHVISQANAQMTVVAEEDIPPFYGIEGQLEQVFVNLITNACHSLKEGGTIDVSISATVDRYIQISIKDSGGGIAPNHLRKVFEPFFTTKNVGKGTGLGLSIVKNILDNHDATIAVDSKEGHGTVFVVTLRGR